MSVKEISSPSGTRNRQFTPGGPASLRFGSTAREAVATSVDHVIDPGLALSRVQRVIIAFVRGAQRIAPHPSANTVQG